MADAAKPALDEAKIGAAAAAGLKPLIGEVLDAIKKPAEAPDPATKLYTQAEIDAAVAKGSISQAQGDRIIREQDRKQLREEIKADVMAEVEGSQRQGSLAGQLARFKELVPDLNNDESPVAKRAIVTYERMLQRGLPKGNATVLSAIEQVCGPLDALEATRTPGKRGEATEDAAGGGSGSGAGGDDGAMPAGLFKGIPNRYRENYADMIDKGYYTGWDDPNIKTELEIVRAAQRKH